MQKQPSSSRQVEEEARRLYETATLLERQGQFGEALIAYRKAYKLVPDLDEALKQPSAPSLTDTAVADSFDTATIADSPVTSSKAATRDKSDPTAWDGKSSLVDHFTRLSFNVAVAPAAALDHSAVCGGVQCRPAAAQRGAHISCLSAELVTRHILPPLADMDVASVALFGRVCKLYYLYSRDRVLWKRCQERHARRHNFCPQRTLHSTLDFSEPRSDSVSPYQFYLDSPRLRCDGCYISKCHYVRQGFTASGFHQPVHVITYYRYLRFFEDGRVLALTTSAVPAQVVYTLGFNEASSATSAASTVPSNASADTSSSSAGASPSSSSTHSTPAAAVPVPRQLLTGHYAFQLDPGQECSLYPSRVQVVLQTSLATAPHNTDSPAVGRRNARSAASSSAYAKQVFRMTLSLHSPVQGAWNRLNWKQYCSTADDLADHEVDVTEFNVKQFKSFWFSRVLKYIKME